MSHEIYIFGSATRGEVSPTSDVDILLVPRPGATHVSYPPGWSVYTAEVVEAYYREGRLFAWHLHREAKCIYSPDGTTLLGRLGPPAPYTTCREDIDDLAGLLHEAIEELRGGTRSVVYELGIVHTAMRDIAMSASGVLLGAPNFSIRCPYLLPLPCPLPEAAYHGTLLARHCSTRGFKPPLDADAIAKAVLSAPLADWVEMIRSRI